MNITELYLTVYNILSKIALESFVLIKKCVFAIKKTGITKNDNK